MSQPTEQQPIKLHFSDNGQGEPIVLLHGFLGSSAYWDEVIPLLSRHYRCIVPDLRGHGHSPVSTDPYTIEDMAADVVSLLDELDLKQVTLLGHSMGGYITLALVDQYPSYIKSWGLVHSTAYEDTEEAKQKRLNTITQIRTRGMIDFVDGFAEGLFAPHLVYKLPDSILKVKEIGYITSPEGGCGAAAAMRERPERLSIIQNANVPVLLVAGEYDPIAPPDRMFVADSTRITTAVIPDIAHMSMMEAPEQLVNIIHDFMQNQLKD